MQSEDALQPDSLPMPHDYITQECIGQYEMNTHFISTQHLDITVIEPDWLCELAPHFYNFGTVKPDWLCELAPHFYNFGTVIIYNDCDITVIEPDWLCELAPHFYNFVIYNDCDITVIEPDWLCELAPHFYNFGTVSNI
ncbi:hypothetical protein KUTeg_019689 [Tegillarca granosa]|uniref:Uncharacterized protein n=1 Tax=Tegillarca granosa TaxID=220873 RepID=A0ABQ9EDC0_TEGGR|nr:hypothetical protein KUTeg_019689 [Tegillarca granosa]